MITVLPAYAGMIPSWCPRLRASRCAPRVCGDDPNFAKGGTGIAQVLPAYAGMILRQSEGLGFVGGAPRVCGDDPVVEGKWPTLMWCSPRMRG